MSECIFCKIASGEIQGLRVWKDTETLAFMDIAKDVDGHLPVIPKQVPFRCISRDYTPAFFHDCPA